MPKFYVETAIGVIIAQILSDRVLNINEWTSDGPNKSVHHTSPIYQWLSITARPSYWPGTAYICLYRDDRINWRVIINFSNATAVWMNQFVYWAIVSMRPLSTFVRDFGNGREIDEIGQLVAMNLLMYMVIYSRGVVCRCFILVSTFNLWKRYSCVKIVCPRKFSFMQRAKR